MDHIKIDNFEDCKDKLKEAFNIFSRTGAVAIRYRYSAIYITDDPTNCKLANISGLGTFYINFRDQNNKFVKFFNDFLRIFRTNVAYSINTTNSKLIDSLKKDFTIASYSRIPIGYHGGNQYNIVVLNPGDIRFNEYNNRVENDNIKNIINFIDKNYNDVNNNDVNNNGNLRISKKEIEKILSYKSKYYLKQRLIKLGLNVED